MFEKIANIFRIPDLRKRVLFTLGLLAVYRIGAHIPTPGINAEALMQFFNQNSGSALGLVDLFSGGNLRRLTIFALGIMPYITASIIFQLLTVIYEPLAKLQKEGELGRRKITQWTRYVTVILAAVQSAAIALTLTNTASGMVTMPGFSSCRSRATLTAGTAFIMWLGEQITERGIGNGMRLLIFTGIVVGLPRGIAELYNKVHDQAWGAFTVPAMVCSSSDGRRGRLHRLRGALRAPHPRAVRQAHRRPAHDGRPIHPPAAQGQLRRRHAGHLRQLHPQRAADSSRNVQFVQNTPSSRHHRGAAPGEPWYELLYMAPSSSSRTSTSPSSSAPTTSPTTCASTAASSPASAPASARPTSSTTCSPASPWSARLPHHHLHHSRDAHQRHPPQPSVWLVGTFFDRLAQWVTNGLGVNFYFGGTSLLIVVGVAMDTVNQVESQLIMRHYEGFSPKSGRSAAAGAGNSLPHAQKATRQPIPRTPSFTRPGSGAGRARRGQGDPGKGPDGCHGTSRRSPPETSCAPSATTPPWPAPPSACSPAA